MRWLIAFCIGVMCIAPTQAQDTKELDAARQRLARTEALAALATLERGVARWDVALLERNAERAPVLALLVKITDAISALKRLEHTLEEREALQSDLEAQVFELEQVDKKFAPKFQTALQEMESFENAEGATNWLVEHGPKSERDRYVAASLTHAEVVSALRFAQREDTFRLNLADRYKAGSVGEVRYRYDQARTNEEKLAEEVRTAHVTSDEAQKALADAKEAGAGAERIKELTDSLETTKQELKDKQAQHEEAHNLLQDCEEYWSQLQLDLEAVQARLEFMAVARESHLESIRQFSRESTEPVIFVGTLREPLGAVAPGRRVVASLDTEELELLRPGKGITHLEVSILKARGDDAPAFYADCIKVIAGMDSLEHLQLSLNNEISGEELAPLSALKKLKTLRVEARFLRKQLVASLAAVPVSEAGTLAGKSEGVEFAKSLSMLSPWKSARLELGPLAERRENFDALGAMPNLAFLSFEPAAAMPELLSALAASKSLRHVSMSGEHVCAAHFKALKGLAVTELHAGGPLVDDDAVAALMELPGLEVISLRGSHGVSAAAVESLNAIKGLKSLDVTMTLGLPRWALSVLAARKPGLKIAPDPDFPRF